MKGVAPYRKGTPEGCVIHYTAGDRDGSVRSALRLGIDNGHSYFLLDKVGTVYQQFDISKYGAHAGESKNPKTGESRVSKTLVGIEIMCAGVLEKDGVGYKSWFNKKIDDFRTVPEYMNMQAGTYQKFTTHQESSLIDLIVWMATTFRTFDMDQVYGHDEVAGPLGLGYWRKTDPGGALSVPMDLFRRMIKTKVSEKLQSLNL